MFLQIFLAILYIVLGEGFCLVRTCLLDELGWYATPYLVVADLCATEYERSCCYYCAFAYDSLVEYGCAHADEGSAADVAGVEGCVMADGDVVLEKEVVAVDEVLGRALLTAEVGDVEA